MIELGMAQVCIELTRYFRGIQPKLAKAGLPPWRRRLIKEYLTHDPGTASLGILAALCGLSVRHLARAFKASSGQSLGRHIAERRLDAVRRMLGQSASVKAAAHIAGFSAPSNFIAAFRHATGCTPRQYRALAARPTLPARRRQARS